MPYDHIDGAEEGKGEDANSRLNGGSSVGAADGSDETQEGQWFEGMSWSTRVNAFILFTVLGFFSSTMAWIALGIGYRWKYSVLTTLGSIMSLCGTFVLMGPEQQLKSMFDPVRRAATIVYLSSLIITLFIAFYTGSALLCFLCGIFQYGSLIWYSLSYVPYGREMLLSFIHGCVQSYVSV